MSSNGYFEYLLKLWIYKNKSDGNILSMFLSSIRSIKNKLIKRIPAKKIAYSGLYVYETLSTVMYHADCSMGALLAIASNEIDIMTQEERNELKQIAIEITNACHDAYNNTETHLGPATFNWENESNPVSIDTTYMLEPELVESYFYLWRLTLDKKYRDWAWDIVEALEKYCKTDSGYSAIYNVESNNSSKMDLQPSYFLSKTLKYLYLMYSDQNTLLLHDYVFSYGAHPFFINKYYRKL
jgi:mannosyl-oligosaccharide alpha-1,2-mannosidase